MSLIFATKTQTQLKQHNLHLLNLMLHGMHLCVKYVLIYDRLNDTPKSSRGLRRVIRIFLSLITTTWECVHDAHKWC